MTISFKRAVLLAATTFVGGGTVMLWLWFMKAGLADILHLHEEGTLSFGNVLVGGLLPALFVAMYIAGFIWLFRRKSGLGKVLLFALGGFVIFFLHVPVIMFIGKMVR